MLKLPDLLGESGNGVRGPALVGALCSAVTAYLAVRFLMRYFETNRLTPFAVVLRRSGRRSLALPRLVSWWDAGRADDRGPGGRELAAVGGAGTGVRGARRRHPFRSDHYLSVEGRRERGSLETWATVAGLAAVTTRLRLGVLVSPATFRHPSVLAKLVTAADHISNGRIELGIGAGWNEREHEAYGFAFPPLGERMELLEEQLAIVRGAWADGPFSFAGKHYRLVASTPSRSRCSARTRP